MKRCHFWCILISQRGNTISEVVCKMNMEVIQCGKAGL